MDHEDELINEYEKKLTDDANQREVKAEKQQLQIQTDDNETTKESKKKLNEDTLTIAMLIILYIFEGIPFGLTTSIPLILITRKQSYADQGAFTFAMWPFALKIIWAPIIDSIFIEKIGKRKTWLVSCCLLMGILMISLANYVQKILDRYSGKDSSSIIILTCIFASIVFLMSIQDVTLDAWSLELLNEKNLGWQSIANTVGMGVGFFTGNALFLTLESPKFCNQYLRPLFKLAPQSYGFVSLEKFFYGFGVMIIITALLILFFKSEHNLRKYSSSSESEKLVLKKQHKRPILASYILIWKMVKLKPMINLIFILLTIRLSFSSEYVVRIKLVEQGVEREKISLLSVIISPILTFLPFIIRKPINGPRPLDFFRIAYCLRITMILVVLFFVYYVPKFKDADNTYSYTFYAVYFLISIVGSVFGFFLFVSLGAFYAKISDKNIGGTYMTFLVFWSNIGGSWSKTATLYLINFFTFKRCVYGDDNNMFDAKKTFNVTTTPFDLETILDSIKNNDCSSDKETKECLKYGAKCFLVYDGFYIITVALVFVGFLWLILTKKIINHLQDLPKSTWKVTEDDEYQKTTQAN